MNRLELRELTLRLSIADRLLLLWDIVRSVFSGRSAEPSQVIPSKEAAIARIETLVNRLWLTRDIFQYTTRSDVMAQFDQLLDNNTPLWATVLQQSESELEKAIEDIAIVYAVGAGFAQEYSPEELKELESVSAG